MKKAQPASLFRSFYILASFTMKVKRSWCQSRNRQVAQKQHV